MPINEKTGGGGHINEPYNTENGRYVKKTEGSSSKKKNSKLLTLTKKQKELRLGSTPSEDVENKNNLSQIFTNEKEKRKTFSNIISLKDFLKYRKGKVKEMLEESGYSDYQKERIETRIKKFAPKMKEFINKGQYTMKMSFGNLIKALNENKFKNQIETKTSGGFFGPDRRIQISNRLFGLDISTFDKYDSQSLEKYYGIEKYGYLSEGSTIEEISDDESGYWYGDCTVVFKKENLKNRMTFCLGDSLDHDCYPQEIDGDVDLYSIGNRFRDNFLYDSKYEKVINSQNLKQLKENLFNGRRDLYVELQYHGDVTADDVKGIIIPFSNIGGIAKLEDTSSPYYHRALSLLNNARNRNFKIYTKSSSGIKEMKMESGKIVFGDVAKGDEI